MESYPSSTRKITLLTISLIIIFPLMYSQRFSEWPWSQAHIGYTGSMGIGSTHTTLNLATTVIQGINVSSKEEWNHTYQGVQQLQGTLGQEIKIGCRAINESTHWAAKQITVRTRMESGEPGALLANQVCDTTKSDCWYNSTLNQSISVVCLWVKGQPILGLSFRFHIIINNATTTPTTEKTTSTTTTAPDTTQTTQPQTKPGPKIYEVGPYMIRNVGQQQLLFNPDWSLKRVELIIQTNISEIQPACLPFVETSFKGWTRWTQKQMHLESRTKRDLTGVLGTGLGVLNRIDSEVLMNKLVTATSDLTRLKQPLQSSLLALGTSQWQVSKILPIWEKNEDQDHRLILDALNMAQNNVSLAFSCIQAQLWLQATAALIIREGNERIFPVEIRKAVWDEATNFERRFQSWWTMVNFTYDSTTNMATAFVLTIRNATVYVIHPIIALGLNHEDTVLYPSEHRAWARKENEKWQTVNVESCITREQQGFICESNTIDTRDICLDTEQSICHFEIHPDNSKKTVIIYAGQGCICLRTACVFVEIDPDNVTLFTGNHSNFCICNFVKITGCDFVYWAPVVSHQLIKSKIINYLELSPTPIGMNLTLVRQLIKHQDLLGILREIQRNGEKTLVTIHHDTKEINRVLQRTKQDASHNWWDTLFGWSPSATGILNIMIHPIVILLGSLGILLVLTIILYLWVWRMFKRITAMHEALYYLGDC
ncbi:uncharacterized protein LOC116964869 [Tyto alba]|uniref:uncharacterized protein LOC116964869 n=1 Tax=Tyto alba TaxID=56313 RepID=UPI001C66E656|nr:uncharacterized protein LOC116964869 [Tyto alba]XP_042660772.1 uncharacterized protein LOC116964869 [Tyto alba]